MKLKKIVLRIYIFISIIGLMILSGTIVRNLHHDVFDRIRKPIEFIVDAPRIVYENFFKGIETYRPNIPKCQAF